MTRAALRNKPSSGQLYVSGADRMRPPLIIMMFVAAVSLLTVSWLLTPERGFPLTLAAIIAVALPAPLGRSFQRASRSARTLSLLALLVPVVAMLAMSALRQGAAEANGGAAVLWLCAFATLVVGVAAAAREWTRPEADHESAPPDATEFRGLMVEDFEQTVESYMRGEIDVDTAVQQLHSFPFTVEWSGAIDQAADPERRAKYVVLAERYELAEAGQKA
jgi:hypothetical protein